MLPKVIDIRLLGTCDLRCPFCFGPQHELAHPPIEKVKTLISKFARLGVSRLVFTGGEPTLIKRLPELLAFSRQHGFMNVLSSNGIALARRVDEICEQIDWLGIPLDSSSRQTNSEMRAGNPKQYDVVLGLLTSLRLSHPRLKIKLGTVASKINVGTIPTILDLIVSRKPDVWKIYQVAASGYAKENFEKLELTDSEFEVLSAQLQMLCAAQGVNLVTRSRAHRTGSYLFMEPNGDAIAIGDRGEDIILGNFFASLDHVVESWRGLVHEAEMLHNYNSTYPDE